MSATALVAASMLMASSAYADSVRYTANGTYTDAMTVRSNDTIYVNTDITAVFAGTVTYGEAEGGFLILNSTSPGDQGTLVFAPTSITASPGYNNLIIAGGVVRFGSDVARDFYNRNDSTVAVAGGVFDLGGVNQSVYRLIHLGNQAGTITNNGPGAAVLTISNEIDFRGQITDGSNVLGLRLDGGIASTLSGNNSYSGGTVLTSGATLTAGHSNALGTGAVNFQGLNSTLSLYDGVALRNDIYVGQGASAVFNVGGNSAGRLLGDITSADPDSTVYKTGAGELVLAGNADVGRIFINHGTLTAGTGSDIRDTASIVLSGGSTFRVAGNEKIGEVVGGGTIRIENGSQLTLGRDQFDTTSSTTIGGDGALRKEGDNLLDLRGVNTYSGGTTLAEGTLVAGQTGALGSGALTVAAEDTYLGLRDTVWLDNEVVLAGGSLNVDIASDATGTLAGGITRADAASGFGLSKYGNGTLVLNGENSNVAFADVNGGMLRVDGSLTAPVNVYADAALSGNGTITGDVTFDGGSLVGRAGERLTINGNLTLSDSTHVNVRLGTPSSVGLFDVSGDLTLDGRLNIMDAGGFGQGVYRLFDYGGTLTDNGLEINGVPGGVSADDITVQTAIDHQVNIVVGDSSGPGEVPTIQFWDGANTTADGQIAGGSGTWNSSSTNWTGANGTANHAWGGNFAVFQGAAGTVTVAAGGVSVTGMQFAVDGYTVNGGPIRLGVEQTVLRVGDGTAAGENYEARIDSVITGAGALVKDDLGTLVLGGNNTYQGDTIVRAGTLVGDTNSIRNDILSNGTVVFNQTVDGTFAGSITGNTGQMRKDGGGTLRLTGLNTLDWDVNDGALSSTTAAFRSDVHIRTEGAMRFEQDASGAYAGTITGSGSLYTAAGAGNIIAFTGNSSDFTGTTTVETGALAVNGQLGGTLEVLAAGRLMGTGTVGDTIVNGTIAPGNSIGTLNVAGDITFNGGSIYEVEASAAGEADRIAATGTATINGGTVRVLAGTGIYAPSIQYTILTANNGVTGTFTGVTSNLAFLTPSLTYDANNAYLTMTRNGVGFENVGVTPNQIATGGGVESLGGGNVIYNAVLNLSADQARDAFDQLSGEIHSSLKTAMIEDSRFVRNAVNDRLRAAFGGVGASGGAVSYVDGKPVPVAANTDGIAVWGQGFGSWGHMGGDGNAARLERSIGGFFVGADAPVFDTWRFGAVAGYSNSSFNAKDRHSSGSSDNYHVGLYGGTQWGDLAFRTGAAYTWHDISTNRSVSFPGFSDTLKGDYNAGTAQVFGELAYGFSMGTTRFEPFANLAYVNLNTDGLRETGGAAALTSQGGTTDATFTTLGLRASTTFDVNGATLTAKGMLGWRHAFGDMTPDTAMRFASGGNAFSIAGVPIARDAAVIEAGLDYAVTPNVTLGVSYGGQFGSGVSDQSFKANFSAKF
ncbi:autotransporter outer membrane beta-barrel domain-containing protein [Methylocystis echinoides]|uniref:Outer membrane autotransporter barrel domain-containing protein n=1 Tax=Methylocystis echinoides TaxID=29468 RepID=A0A9W6GWE3_9HYPH|nr:autotransporter domain-containing protein [Methylocystis echinoides]GLI94262.1 outer membrane autotransporter barrel domain-containing protein [Methylocystis echinoides]